MNGQPRLDPRTARERGREARRALGRSARRDASAAIVATLARLPELTAATAVAGYLPTEDEVDLRALWSELRGRGTRMHLPRIHDGAGRGMDFVAWEPGGDLSPNRFGVPEPSGPPVGVGTLEVVVLPCVAVDDEGARVGFGAGYYDRALAAAPGTEPRRIGVAFDVQRVAAIESRDWDVPLDVVVTDTVVLRPR